MQPEPANRKQLLVVDDDPRYLASASAALKDLSQGRWSIRTTTNHSEALEQLKARPADAILLDLEMPVMDGIEFLRLLGRTLPGQQVVMLAPRIDEAARKTALDLGAALFLQKPSSLDGYRALFTAVDALAGAVPQAGFRGIMQRVGLEDVLQMECLSRKSSILSISTGNRQGQIVICDGEIIHAESGKLQGEMALYSLLALTGGEFKLLPFTEPPRRSVSGQYQFLLMEAARLRDESGAEGGRPEPGSLGKASDFGAGSLEAVTPTEACGIRIEEVLLCSSAGEVLYDWKCESIEQRLDLFKRLEEQAMTASKGTPSGRFHRVSMDTGESRVTVKLQPSFKLLVRTALPAQPAPQ